jgi:hypothetical protein
MTPSPYKIFCIGLIWFIYTLKTFFRFIKCKLKALIHFIKFSYISFLYNSEKEYFNHINNKSFKYPSNLAIVLNKFFIGEEKILETICRFIKWIKLTNQIKYFTIYDAFNLLVLDKLIKKLTEEVNTDNNIYENVHLHIAYKDNKNNIIIEKKISNDKISTENKNLITQNIYICIIGFDEANNNLIKKIVKEKDTKIYGNYPEVYKWFNKEDSKPDIKKNKLYEKYLTRKNEISLPELILTFGKNKYLFYEDICLYGFPFTLLENAEIININHKQIDQIDILDFIDIFNQNSKIIKRFGA